jgi:hypothetical protein
VSPRLTDIEGRPLSQEVERILEHLRSRSASLGTTGIRDRVRTAARELENDVAAVSEAEARRRPIADKWTIAEVVDQIAQTQIRAVEELRPVLAGRRPPGPPVYEAVRSGAAKWAPWPELIDGLRSANENSSRCSPRRPDRRLRPARPQREPSWSSPALAGGPAPQIFIADLDWREYALIQRLHLLDHREQIRSLHEAMTGWRPAQTPDRSGTPTP